MPKTQMMANYQELHILCEHLFIFIFVKPFPYMYILYAFFISTVVYLSVLIMTNIVIYQQDVLVCVHMYFSFLVCCSLADNPFF